MGTCKWEFIFCDFDEFLLGISTAYGEDEFGQFHMISIGFLLFQINIISYN